MVITVKTKRRDDCEKVCAYCENAAALHDGHFLCNDRGVVAPDGYCRKFCYDPLKRVPLRAKKPKLEYVSLDGDDGT